ncbi:probable sodium/metabolite cotransporter BASS5, chloroplastic isoform X2 [Diospyros lotus]|uniref:probable sodium/metabolite cotransporter BASS5, chloroplastic isoform X2 n=1 Tax=Diospyros lotus TaxID=55363 RepID=UPI002258F209|nr:probable sodium/metabolite cotransporter BASS5, chloroplastic isoform X2 [Diospyros lotus]
MASAARLLQQSSSCFQIYPPFLSPFCHINNISSIPNNTLLHFPPKCRYFSGQRSRLLLSRCVTKKLSDEFEPDQFPDALSEPTQILKSARRRTSKKHMEASFLKILGGANAILPHVVLASTVLALLYPPSFTWFTSRYYAPALGFLMFAVGVNSSEKDFLEAFKRPGAIFAGYIGQFVVKPFLGYVFGLIAMTVFGLPTSLGAGIMLTSCVSGAQLSNYATFLTDPPMAPLSIVMTSLSTATAVFVTPILSLLLIGKRLPVDVTGMISSILQIVVAPIVGGLLLNRFFPLISNAIRPFLPPLSVFVTSLCVGAPLAININSVISPFGASVLLLVIAFHFSAFVAGYFLSGLAFSDAPDVKALQRTLSYETEQSSSPCTCKSVFPRSTCGCPSCNFSNSHGSMQMTPFTSTKYDSTQADVGVAPRERNCVLSTSLPIMLILWGCNNVINGFLSCHAVG